MTVIYPNRPITRIVPTNSEVVSGITISEAVGIILMNIKKLQAYLQNMDKDVNINVRNRFKKAISAHNKSNNIIE